MPPDPLSRLSRRRFLGGAMAGAALAAWPDLAVPADPAPARLTGRVVLPGEPDYDEARRVYNERFSLFPQGIVFCRSVADVANAVRWARARGIRIAVRGGRHSYEAFSLIDDGLVIDVSEMNRIRVDPDRGRAFVQAGTQLMAFAEALAPYGVTVPAGSCPTVGIAGLTLGGGYGFLARALGMTCDSLLGLVMVDASGQVLSVDSAHHPDLLWAARGGGGGNFGVVTSLTFRVHPVSSVTVYHLRWDWAAIRPVLEAWQDWAPDVDDRLTSILQLLAPAYGAISSTGLFLGTEDRLRPLLKPLLEAASPQSLSVETMPFLDAVRLLAGLKPGAQGWTGHWHDSRVRFKHSSDYAHSNLGPAGIETLLGQLRQAPSPSNSVQLAACGGAIGRVAVQMTAFVHRHARFSLQYQSYWKEAAGEEPNAGWVNRFRQAMQPYVSGGAYCNYSDLAIKNWPVAYYGANWPRLVAVKRRYDPNNLFRFAQSIPPAGHPGHIKP